MNILAIAPTKPALDKILPALHNEYGVKAYGIGISPNDTCFKYQIQTDNKLSKTRLNELSHFCKGFITALNSF